jgi:molybdate-binding protein
LNAKPYNQKYDFVCINDGGESKLTSQVLEILDSKFPEKSDWEI